MRPLKPTITMHEAEEWARERYGIETSGTQLPGEIDRNVLLTAADGRRWVLKLAPAASDRTEIACQLAVLQHLEHTDLHDVVQTVVQDLHGEVMSTVRTAAGDEGLLRVVTHLPGMPLAKLDRATDELRHEIGQILARLDNALIDFDHPGAHRHLVWDLVNLLELTPLVEDVEPDLQPLVAAGLDAFATHVVPHLADLPRSVVQNDANDYNLLVSEDGVKLTGVIDFGDMVHTITVAELAIACAYAMLDTPNPRAAADAITAGYISARPLTDLERDLLPHLITARLCNSLLMSAQARTLDPDDEYLRISERPVADLLKRLQT